MYAMNIFVILLAALCSIPVNEGFFYESLQTLDFIAMEKCLEKGENETLLQWKNFQPQLIDCIKYEETLKQEIMDNLLTSKKHGYSNFDYKKYCRSSKTIEQCVSNAMSILEPCMEKNEATMNNIMVNATFKLIDFLCSRNGHRIKLFIESGGPQCVEALYEQLDACLLTFIMKQRFQEPGVSCSGNKFVINCFFTTLMQCSTQTPAVIAKSVLHYAWKLTPCGNMSLVDDINNPVEKILESNDYCDAIAEMNEPMISKSKCESIGGPTAFLEAEKARIESYNCLFNSVNIEELSKYGQVERIPKIICRVLEEYDNCSSKSFEAVSACLGKKEMDMRKLGQKIFLTFSKMLCHEKNNRLESFFAEGGFQCIKDKQVEIAKECLKATFRRKTPVDILISATFFGKEKCREMKEKSSCTIQILKRCPSSSIAEIADSLIKDFIKLTPCNESFAENTTMSINTENN